LQKEIENRKRLLEKGEIAIPPPPAPLETKQTPEDIARIELEKNVAGRRSQDDKIVSDLIISQCQNVLEDRYQRGIQEARAVESRRDATLARIQSGK
jgi:hypothetical protein